MVTQDRLERTFRDSVLTLKFGGNMAVLHTMPSTADAVAYVIDYMKWPEVLGTVAGDDTIFCVLDKPESAAVFASHFNFKGR